MPAGNRLQLVVNMDKGATSVGKNVADVRADAFYSD